MFRLEPVSFKGNDNGGYDTVAFSGSVPVGNAKVSLLGLGKPRSLGLLSQLSGPTWIRRFRNKGGIEMSASDDHTEQRFAYQLGDRVYYSDQDRIRSAELPCGARAVFDAVVPHSLMGMLRGEEEWAGSVE